MKVLIMASIQEEPEAEVNCTKNYIAGLCPSGGGTDQCESYYAANGIRDCERYAKLLFLRNLRKVLAIRLENEGKQS